MPNYFNSLRRKIGVTTLVLACVFMAGWVRSSFLTDRFAIITPAQFGFVIFSLDHHFVLGTAVDPSLPPVFEGPNWATSDFVEFDELYTNFPSVLRWRSFGFSFVQDDIRAYCTAPYWSIVLPLTLLSAYLLLSKSRPAKHAEPPITTAN